MNPGLNRGVAYGLAIVTPFWAALLWWAIS
jgi:hypothetical protein